MLPCLTVDLDWDFREKCLLTAMVDGVKKGGCRCSFEVRRFSLRFWPYFAGFLGANQDHFILVPFKMVPVHWGLLLGGSAPSAEQGHVKSRLNGRGRSLWHRDKMSFRGQRELKQLVTSLETTHWCPCPRESHPFCQREAVLGGSFH